MLSCPQSEYSSKRSNDRDDLALLSLGLTPRYKSLLRRENPASKPCVTGKPRQHFIASEKQQGAHEYCIFYQLITYLIATDSALRLTTRTSASMDRANRLCNYFCDI